MNTSVIIEPIARRRRRRYSEEFKAEVIRACQHSAFRRLDCRRCNVQSSQTPAFLPLQLAAPMREPRSEIQIELCRGGTTVKVNWPASAAAECASWMRELLR